MTSDISALSHLIAVVKITTKSRDIALAALHEARTKPVAYGRVFQLRQVAQDLHREVHRLVAAMEKLESSPLKPGRSPEKQAQLDSLARIARMASGAGPGRSKESYDRSMGKPVVRTGSEELASERDEKKLRRNMDCLT